MRKEVGGKLTVRGEKLGSDEFCKIGLAAARMAYYPEHMLPSPHKNTDLGAPSFRNYLSIKSLNAYNTPKSLQEHRLGSIRFQKNSFPFFAIISTRMNASSGQK